VGWWAFGIALAGESGLAIASLVFSPRFFPSSYARAPHRAKLWHTTVAALLPAVVAPSLAIPGLVEVLRRRRSVRDLLLEAPNASLWRATGVAVAHFGFDLAVMVVSPSDFSKAMGPSLFKQMLVHHALSLLAWPYALARGRCVAPVGYYITTELSNIFLNLRWLFVEQNRNGVLRLALDAAFFVSFSLFRVVPVALALYVAAATDWTHYLRASNWLDIALTTLTVIPFGLNLFWYSIIIRKVKKKFARDEPRPTRERSKTD